MYTEYFGLREKPFDVTPDPRFFYANGVYREAFATLLYGIQERKGFVMLTGEVGTGKTTLLRRLVAQLNPAIKVVFFYNTTLTFDEMVEYICAELGISVAGLSHVRRLHALNAFLVAEAEQGGCVVLILDEAQNLEPAVLENLRLISNLETATAKLVQIVLVGQPELAAKLTHRGLRQVAQRIAIRHRLRPLADDEVKHFVIHRLRVAGCTRRDLFTRGAIRRLVAHAHGIPRVINILCDNALLVAYGAGATRVTRAIVDEAAADLRPSLDELESAALPAAGLRRRSRWRRLLGRPRGGGGRAWRLGRAAAALAAVALVGAGASLAVAWHLGPFGTGGMGLVRGSRPVVAPAAPPNGVSGAVVTPVPGDRRGTAAPRKAVDAPAADRVAPEAPSRPARLASTPSMPDGASTPAAAPGPEPEAGRAHRVAVSRGATLSAIALEHYGGASALGLDLIAELNPELRDIDVLRVGQTLRLPRLDLESRTRSAPDGSFRFIVASYPVLASASEAARAIRRLGFDAVVTSRTIAPGRQMHRVEIERLGTREAVVRAAQATRHLRSAEPGLSTAGDR
jgi:general secretion pathway protein A